MRLALLAPFATAAALAACAPVPATPYGYSYGYTEVQTAPVVPYGGAYAPGYYPEPVYAAPYAAPYVSPGPTIIGGGGGRGYDRYRNDRYRDDRRFDGGYRGRPNPGPARDYRGDGGRPNFGGGGGRPTPAAAPAPRPAPAPPQFSPAPSRDPGHAPDFNPANPGAQGGADR